MSAGVTAGEVDDLTSHLNSTREQLEQNEREKLNLAEEKSYLQRVSEKERKRERERGRVCLCSLYIDAGSGGWSEGGVRGCSAEDEDGIGRHATGEH